jgi:hypothetical protein
MTPVGDWIKDGSFNVQICWKNHEPAVVAERARHQGCANRRTPTLLIYGGEALLRQLATAKVKQNNAGAAYGRAYAKAPWQTSFNKKKVSKKENNPNEGDLARKQGK